MTLLEDFGTGSFPCGYLGLPLNFRKTTRIERQLLIDKIATRMKAWKGKLLSGIGRIVLVNSIL